MKIRAYDLGDTISPGPLAAAFGVAQVTRWEDPLVVSFHDREVFVYQFGAVVFFGHEEELTGSFFAELERATGRRYHPSRAETFASETVSDPPFAVKDWQEEEFVLDRYEETAYFNAAHAKSDYVKMLAFVLAQSATLERFDRLADEVAEESIRTLEWYAARLRYLPLLRNRALLATVKLLRERQKIMSELMVLEKPALTWQDTVCDEIYETLAKHFELSRRARVVETKLGASLETAQSLQSITEASRNTLLEVLIVLLIVWEIVWEFIKAGH